MPQRQPSFQPDMGQSFWRYLGSYPHSLALGRQAGRVRGLSARCCVAIIVIPRVVRLCVHDTHHGIHTRLRCWLLCVCLERAQANVVLRSLGLRLCGGDVRLVLVPRGSCVLTNQHIWNIPRVWDSDGVLYASGFLQVLASTFRCKLRSHKDWRCRQWERDAAPHMLLLYTWSFWKIQALQVSHVKKLLWKIVEDTVPLALPNYTPFKGRQQMWSQSHPPFIVVAVHFFVLLLKLNSLKQNILFKIIDNKSPPPPPPRAFALEIGA